MDTPSPENPLSPPASAELKQPNRWEIYLPQKILGHRQSVFLASFPPIVYLWPTIAWLLFAGLLQGVLGVSPYSLGWLTVIIVATNLIVFVQDFDQKQFVILMLLIGVLCLLVWILQLYGMTFMQSFALWIAEFAPTLSTHAFVILGFLLLVLLVWGMTTPLFDYWRFEQNEFVHYTQPIGRDMSIARANCTIYKEIPDVFESLLTFGGGTVIIRRDTQTLATIPHVPLLAFRMKYIEHIMSETRVTVEKE